LLFQCSKFISKVFAQFFAKYKYIMKIERKKHSIYYLFEWYFYW